MAAPLAVGSWVALGDQVGQISRLDSSGKCAVSIVNGPTKWRTLADVKSIFGSSGVPKSQLVPGDWVRLQDKGAGETVGQLLKVEGGRFNVRLMDGKVLWRGNLDLMAPFDDAPKLPILGSEPSKAAQGRPSIAAVPPAAPSAPPASTAAPAYEQAVLLRPHHAEAQRNANAVARAKGKLRVQASGVGGGTDLLVEHDELVNASTVGNFKRHLRLQLPACVHAFGPFRLRTTRAADTHSWDHPGCGHPPVVDRALCRGFPTRGKLSPAAGGRISRFGCSSTARS